ncbi:class I SAM-dependent methyltransferase [Candidatus Methanomassiliicoccus intestinalis]|uniref:class I SAM-dependent methyltransferase n=1 Tax=Candidatus Methanomassiliicoccus intestinalis TaxID=1406512 RepID=UPI0037DDAEEB
MILKSKQNYQKIAMSAGFYPENIVNAIDELIKEGIVESKEGEMRLTNKGRQKIGDMPFYLFSEIDLDLLKAKLELAIKNMPDAHLLEYQWWFTCDTCIRLLGVLTENILLSNPKIAFIGAPILALAFNYAFPELEIYIYDISQTILLYLEGKLSSTCKCVCIDVLNETKDEASNVKDNYFDIVFMDPPFYVEHYVAFIKLSNRMLSYGGDLYSTIFNENIKTNLRERKIIFNEFCKNFTFISMLNNEIFYNVPRFELNTYKAMGYNSEDISDWRYNSLLYMKKNSYYSNEEDINIERGIWNEYCFNKKRIFVKTSISNCINIEIGDWEIKPLYNEDCILKSVSRRYSERDKISLWTSDNEVFVVGRKGLALVNEILTELEQNNKIDLSTLEVKYGIDDCDIHKFIDKLEEITYGR